MGRINNELLYNRDLNLDGSELIVGSDYDGSTKLYLLSELADYFGNGSGGTWGTITGTLSDQTDLQNALDEKADLANQNIFEGRNFFRSFTNFNNIVTIDATDANSNLISMYPTLTAKSGDQHGGAAGVMLMDPDGKWTFLSQNGAGKGYRFNNENISTLREFVLPDKNGTIALLDDIPSGGGGGSWGSITGILSDQTDLQGVLDDKANLATNNTFTGFVNDFNGVVRVGHSIQLKPTGGTLSYIDGGLIYYKGESVYRFSKDGEGGSSSLGGLFDFSNISGSNGTERNYVFPNKSGTVALLDDIPSGGGSSNTIYTADDSLTGTRIVNLDGNQLTFSNGSANIVMNNGRLGVSTEVYGPARLGDNEFQAKNIDVQTVNFKDDTQGTVQAMFMNPSFTVMNHKNFVSTVNVNSFSSKDALITEDAESTLGLRIDYTNGSYYVSDYGVQNYSPGGATTPVTDVHFNVLINGGGAEEKDYWFGRYNGTDYGRIFSVDSGNTVDFEEAPTSETYPTQDYHLVNKLYADNVSTYEIPIVFTGASGSGYRLQSGSFAAGHDFSTFNYDVGVIGFTYDDDDYVFISKNVIDITDDPQGVGVNIDAYYGAVLRLTNKTQGQGVTPRYIHFVPQSLTGVDPDYYAFRVTGLGMPSTWYFNEQKIVGGQSEFAQPVGGISSDLENRILNENKTFISYVTSDRDINTNDIELATGVDIGKKVFLEPDTAATTHIMTLNDVGDNGDLINVRGNVLKTDAVLQVIEGTANIVNLTGSNNSFTVSGNDIAVLSKISSNTYRIDGSYTEAEYTPPVTNLYQENSAANGGTGTGSWTPANNATVTGVSDGDFTGGTALSIEHDGVNRFSATRLSLLNADVAVWSGGAITEMEAGATYRISFEHKGTESQGSYYVIRDQGGNTEGYLNSTTTLQTFTIDWTVDAGGANGNAARIELSADINSPYSGTLLIGNFRIERL